MRCSDCSKAVTPIVAVDIDGTLGVYHNHFLGFAEQYLGYKLNPGYDGSCEFDEWLGLERDLYEEVKLAYRQGGMKRSMPLYPGAQTLCNAIRRAGAELWIATTRPYLRLDNIDPDTQEWLRRNEISYDGLVYGEDKYHRFVKLVDTERVVAVIEDLPQQIHIAQKLGLPTVHIWRKHNEAYQYEPGTEHLLEAWVHISHRIHEWTRSHHGLTVKN